MCVNFIKYGYKSVIRFMPIFFMQKGEKKVYQRGDIYYADLSPVVGSEQGGVRPVLIIQNNTGNKHSPTVIAAAITSKKSKVALPTHVKIEKEAGLAKSSMVLLEQVRTIDKKRLKQYLGRIGKDTMTLINRGLQVSFGLSE